MPKGAQQISTDLHAVQDHRFVKLMRMEFHEATSQWPKPVLLDLQNSNCRGFQSHFLETEMKRLQYILAFEALIGHSILMRVGSQQGCIQNNCIIQWL